MTMGEHDEDDAPTSEEVGRIVMADLYWVRSALIEAEFQFRKTKLGGAHGPTPYTSLLEQLPVTQGHQSTWGGSKGG